jgi:hypothetical protein
MSLTTNVRNRLMDAINMAFDMVGNDAATKMPRMKVRDNKGPIAWEFFVASHISARARARLDLARRAAIASGIIFDHTKNPREAGTNEQVYNGEHVAVWLTVRNAATTVSADKMSTYLIEKGVDAKLVADAYLAASSKARPAHEFKVSLVASEPTGK